MKLLSPTPFSRLNEVAGFLLLSLGLVVLLSLASYHVQDPSWDTATDAHPLNLVGYPGAYLSDLLLQSFGAAALLLPFALFLLSWKWIRSEQFQAGGVKVFGFGLLLMAASSGVSFLPIRTFFGHIPLGGVVGLALATWLVDSLNLTGALLAITTAAIVSIYLVSTFTIGKASTWFSRVGLLRRFKDLWRRWRERARQRAAEKAEAKAEARRLMNQKKGEARMLAREAAAARRAASRAEGLAPLEESRVVE